MAIFGSRTTKPAFGADIKAAAGAAQQATINATYTYTVGTAEWAEANLGGTWQDSPTKVGIGWTWSEADGWRPPQPSPDCVWDDATGAWDCPPEPEPPLD